MKETAGDVVDGGVKEEEIDEGKEIPDREVKGKEKGEEGDGEKDRNMLSKEDGEEGDGEKDEAEVAGRVTRDDVVKEDTKKGRQETVNNNVDVQTGSVRRANKRKEDELWEKVLKTPSTNNNEEQTVSKKQESPKPISRKRKMGRKNRQTRKEKKQLKEEDKLRAMGKVVTPSPQDKTHQELARRISGM